MMKTEEIKLTLTSSYGDGWFDGYLEAKGTCPSVLDDTTEEDVLKMSEYAEENANTDNMMYKIAANTLQWLVLVHGDSITKDSVLKEINTLKEKFNEGLYQ